MLTIALTTAQQALVMAHLFVADIAVRIYTSKAKRRYIFGELMSSAHLGLCHAAQHFDEFKRSERTGMPVKFSTYARRSCDHQIIDDVNEDRLIHIPKNHFKAADKRRKTRRYEADATRALNASNRPTETLDELEWRR